MTRAVSNGVNASAKFGCTVLDGHVDLDYRNNCVVSDTWSVLGDDERGRFKV